MIADLEGPKRNLHHQKFASRIDRNVLLEPVASESVLMRSSWLLRYIHTWVQKLQRYYKNASLMILLPSAWCHLLSLYLCKAVSTICSAPELMPLFSYSLWQVLRINPHQYPHLLSKWVLISFFSTSEFLMISPP